MAPTPPPPPERPPGGIGATVSAIALSVVGPGVIALSGLFYQQQISAARLEAILAQVQASITELKEESKDRGRQYEDLRNAVDVRLRAVEGRR